ncbi:MAG: NCS2 family permease [Thermoplasmata archaeon]|nr:NCS2 family permease [Thermoplasmata archaeon]
MDGGSALDRFFGIAARGSSVGTEVKGGVIVFLAMSYIIAVNTGMMRDAGMDPDSAFTATVIMAVIGSLVMGLYARFPAAMAPGMGINAMFCYTAVVTMGFTWQEALLGVVLSGILFFALTVSGVRKAVMDRIPYGVKCGMIAGIGCFIAFIGLQNAGIVVDSASTLVTLGDMSDPSVLLSVFCIAVTVFLAARGSSMGILVGMLATAVVGMAAGIIPLPDSVLATPSAPAAGAFLDGIGDGIMSFEFLMVVISLAFVEFFDGSGTLLALGQRANLTDSEGNVDFGRAINVDAGVASLSGAVGCTPATAFAESAVGIEAGARTGLMSVTVALLFALALFIAPVFQVFDYSCTVGAMIVVGATMASELKGTEWNDLPTAMTVVSMILMMVLTYSITNGIAFGVILYCVAMAGAGRAREVSPALYALAVVFLVYFVAYAISF